MFWWVPLVWCSCAVIAAGIGMYRGHNFRDSELMAFMLAGPFAILYARVLPNRRPHMPSLKRSIDADRRHTLRTLHPKADENTVELALARLNHLVPNGTPTKTEMAAAMDFARRHHHQS